MNIVPVNAGQGGIRAFVQNALRAGRFLGPGAMNAAINLARAQGPDVLAWVRREVIRGGRRIFRGFRRREHGPMADQNRGPYQLGPSYNFSQGRRGYNGMVRGGQGGPRGGLVRRARGRWGIRTGGRPRRYIRPEKKYFDNHVTSHVLANNITGVLVPLVPLSVGAESFQRIGRKIFLKSLILTGRIRSSAPPSATQASDTVWIWVVLDTQANATTPAITDVWSNTTGHGALRNLDNGPRFKILKCIECKVDYGQSGVDVNVPYEQYLLINKTVHFKNAGGTSPEKNNLLIFAGTANSNNTTLVIDMYTRVRFTDA